MEGRSSLGIVGVRDGDVDAKRYACFTADATAGTCGIGIGIALEDAVGALVLDVVNVLTPTGPYNGASTTLDGKTLGMPRNCPARTLRRARIWRAQPIYRRFMGLRLGLLDSRASRSLFCVELRGVKNNVGKERRIRDRSVNKQLILLKN